jgi:hypothetical protein
VRPKTCVKSLLQAKWRDHRCRRGLNNGTMRPVFESRARVFEYVWPLHDGHAQASSAGVFPAPRERGRMCSQTKGAQENVAGCRQYSQQLPARSRTRRRNARGIASDAIRAACVADLRFAGPYRSPARAR